MPRSYSWNAYEGTLTSTISPLSTDIAVDTLVPFEARTPGYLVLEPESPTKREYIRFDGVSGSTFTGCDRGLGGSVDQAQEHLSNTKIRAVAMHQMFDDLWDSVEDSPLYTNTVMNNHIADPSDPHPNSGYLGAAHASDTGDPHAAADYMKEADAAAAYLPIVDHPVIAVSPFSSGGQVTTSPAVIADCTLTIPAHWNTYDIATVGYLLGAVTGTQSEVTIGAYTDGGSAVTSDLYFAAGISFVQTLPNNGAILAQTDTGAVTVALSARIVTGTDPVTKHGAHIMAIATRTS